MAAAEGRGSLAAYAEAVEAENERLRDRVAALEDTLGMRFAAPVVWRLTPSESALVGCLLARDLCTKEALLLACQRDPLHDLPEIKIVDVFVCKARKKLKPFGIEIETRWGLGYFMSAATKALARTFMEAEPCA